MDVAPSDSRVGRVDGRTRGHQRWLWIAVAALWCVFALLAWRVHGQHSFGFDAPLLRWAHSQASASLNVAAIAVSKLGYAWGVIPIDVTLVFWLAVRGPWRRAAFALTALAGAAALTVACKHLFARARPGLWEVLTPEATFSFPSAHASGSAALVTVLTLLAWHGRLRWPVLVCALVVGALVGASRIYLGVHYPSDVLAGWCLAVGWVMAVYASLYRDGLPCHQRAVKTR